MLNVFTFSVGWGQGWYQLLCMWKEMNIVSSIAELLGIIS